MTLSTMRIISNQNMIFESLWQRNILGKEFYNLKNIFFLPVGIFRCLLKILFELRGLNKLAHQSDSHSLLNSSREVALAFLS